MPLVKNKFLVTLLVFSFCGLTIFLVKTLKPNPQEVLKQRLVERSLGSEKAPIWITEYFDYQCPPCAKASALLKDIMEKNPGLIYLQVRYNPLPKHEHALKAAMYAECVSRQKGKFWNFHEAIFAHQNEWAQDNYAQLHFAEYAQANGVDVNKLDACAHDPAVETLILDEKKKGAELGVQITPSFFINGKLVVGVDGLVRELQTLGKK